MEQNVNYEDVNNSLKTTRYLKYNLKTRCPFCDTDSHFEILRNGYAENAKRIVFLAVCAHCSKIVAAEFCSKYDNYGSPEFKCLYPSAQFKYSFPNEIGEFSSKFVSTYIQAMSAKQNGYDELVGMGLRRAFEFLITDYVANVLMETPKKNLADRISQLDVKNAKIHATLVRWIGNDYTHTELRHPEFTVDDMIKSIGVVVYYLHAEYLSSKLEEQGVSPT